MNILITGAAGFVGKNLVASLKNIQEKKIEQDLNYALKKFMNMIFIQIRHCLITSVRKQILYSILRE